jgi:polyisoprenoid-binding protein YceI
MGITLRRIAFVVPALAAALATAPAMAQEGKTEYTIDAVHSGILWKVQHKGAGYTYGRFNDFSGTVKAEGRNPESLEVNLTIKADSIDSANAKRDEHLRNADFFNTKEFPEITFKSKSAKKIDENKAEITGDLTVRGVTKEVMATAELIGTSTDKGKKLVGAEATFSINRHDFGVSYGKGALGDEVFITVGLEATSK